MNWGMIGALAFSMLCWALIMWGIWGVFHV